MVDLNEIANVAEILGGVTVIGGAFFALVQLREYRTQRRDGVAAELTRSFQNAELGRAVRLVRQLPDGVPAAELRNRGEDFEEAAIIVVTTYETIGLLAYRQIASFSMVRELTGGLAVVMWRKLSRWTEEIRQEQSQPSWAEWFQWLAERLQEAAEHDDPRPAYERFAAWRPRT